MRLVAANACPAFVPARLPFGQRTNERREDPGGGAPPLARPAQAQRDDGAAGGAVRGLGAGEEGLLEGRLVSLAGLSCGGRAGREGKEGGKKEAPIASSEPVVLCRSLQEHATRPFSAPPAGEMDPPLEAGGRSHAGGHH